MPHFKCVSKRNEIYKDFIQKTKKKTTIGIKMEELDWFVGKTKVDMERYY